VLGTAAAVKLARAVSMAVIHAYDGQNAPGAGVFVYWSAWERTWLIVNPALTVVDNACVSANEGAGIRRYSFCESSSSRSVRVPPATRAASGEGAPRTRHCAEAFAHPHRQARSRAASVCSS
jgi:hypothetical protein